MNLFISIIIGIIQGLTEFIPISSTAHLTLFGKLFGLVDPQHPEHWTAFIAVVQLGTLIAVLSYFANDLRCIIISFFNENITKNRISIRLQSHNSRMGWFIIIGTVPIVAVGLLFKDIIEGSLTKDLYFIAINLIFFGVLLGFADFISKRKKNIESTKWYDALIVGIAQCFALFPGASRSGTTITAGLFLGMERDSAAKFSFLLSIPAVLASGLLEFKESLAYISWNDFLSLFVAILAAAISGYVSIAFLLKFLKSRSTFLFAIYRIALGAGIIAIVYGKMVN